MQTYKITNTDLEVTRLGYGCMAIGGAWNTAPYSHDEKRRAEKVIRAALDCGINFFDHADIYTFGKSEQIFGEIIQLQPGLRQKLIIQTKCGIRVPGDPQESFPGRYDFSYSHIVQSVEGSLHRLQTDYLDILLLHRPDPLVEPEEVARAFADLHSSGKVRYFGVSNHTGDQISLLQKLCDQPLVINQLELNLLHNGLINDGIVANQVGGMYTGASGILDYCQLHGILIQAWSPVARGSLIDPAPEASELIRKTAAHVNNLAVQKSVSREAIALAWLLHHPAGIQPLVGTTNPDRLRASCQADGLQLSREDWYALFTTARGAPVP